MVADWSPYWKFYKVAKKKHNILAFRHFSRFSQREQRHTKVFELFWENGFKSKSRLFFISIEINSLSIVDDLIVYGYPNFMQFLYC